jgi:hypothetical protein
MFKQFIRWRLLLNAFNKQPASRQQSELQYVRFKDCGVILLSEVAFPEPKNPKKKKLSELERAVLSALVERKRARLLH